MVAGTTYAPEMETLPVVRVAAVQAMPVVLDLEASLDKALGLIAEAAAQGAELVVFPETFLSLYPSYAWAHLPGGDGDAFWERFWGSWVEVPGPAVDRLVDGVPGARPACAIGVNERELDRPGSVYNTLLLLGPDGLSPAPQADADLPRAAVPRDRRGRRPGRRRRPASGRLGGLICWENRMPLARWAVYQGGPQIWLAPTADDSEGWQATIRHIAIESGAFVVSVPQFIQSAGFPDDFPWPLPDSEVFGRGGAAVVAPGSGEVIAGPLYDEEGLVVADCDLRQTLHAKRWFDVAGHYSRADVLWPGPR